MQFVEEIVRNYLIFFKLTKTVREDIIKAGQDTDKPDFGRKNLN